MAVTRPHNRLPALKRAVYIFAAPGAWGAALHPPRAPPSSPIFFPFLLCLLCQGHSQRAGARAYMARFYTPLLHTGALPSTRRARHLPPLFLAYRFLFSGVFLRRGPQSARGSALHRQCNSGACARVTGGSRCDISTAWLDHRNPSRALLSQVLKAHWL